MLNEDEQNANSSHKSWLWSDCKLVLRRTNPKNLTQQSYENLEAEVQLECQQIAEKFMPVLTFEKDLLHDTSNYYWKKGIPLPTLTVKLQESYFQLLKQDEDYIVIYSELTVVYPDLKQTHFYLEEVKTFGQKIKQFSEDGFLEFAGIILKECSLQKKYNKFSLLVKVCASSKDQSKIILKTLISTAFFVINSRIKRKNTKSKLSIKFFSPKKFLKPLSSLKSLEKNFNKQNLLNFLRNCNQNTRLLLHTHPLHMIYHFNEILKLYYNSNEVDDLFELLETIAPKLTNCNKLVKFKKSSLIYQLKKTKQIKKNQQNQDKKIRKKLSLIIKPRKKLPTNSENKLLLVTFKDTLINDIKNAIEMEKIENQSSSFENEFLKQIDTLSKIFDEWNSFSIKIDFLKEESESDEWKDIHKDNVYEAYSRHYRMTKNRLFLLPKRNILTLTNHQKTF